MNLNITKNLIKKLSVMESILSTILNDTLVNGILVGTDGVLQANGRDMHMRFKLTTEELGLAPDLPLADFILPEMAIRYLRTLTIGTSVDVISDKENHVKILVNKGKKKNKVGFDTEPVSKYNRDYSFIYASQSFNSEWFRSAISKCSYAISTDTNKPIYTAAHLVVKDRKADLFSCNGFNMAVITDKTDKPTSKIYEVWLADNEDSHKLLKCISLADCFHDESQASEWLAKYQLLSETSKIKDFTKAIGTESQDHEVWMVDDNDNKLLCLARHFFIDKVTDNSHSTDKEKYSEFIKMLEELKHSSHPVVVDKSDYSLSISPSLIKALNGIEFAESVLIGFNRDKRKVFVMPDDSTLIYCNLNIDGKLLNYEEQINKGSVKFTLSTKVLTNIVKQICLFDASNKNSIPMKMTIKEDEIVCNYKNSVTTFEESMDVENAEGFTGDYCMGINPEYFLDTLKNCVEEKTTFRFEHSLKPLGVYNGDLSAIVVPMRINKEG